MLKCCQTPRDKSQSLIFDDWNPLKSVYTRGHLGKGNLRSQRSLYLFLDWIWKGCNRYWTVCRRGKFRPDMICINIATAKSKRANQLPIIIITAFICYQQSLHHSLCFSMDRKCSNKEICMISPPFLQIQSLNKRSLKYLCSPSINVRW